MKETTSRRRFVAVTGVAGLIALAGCADEDEEDNGEEDPDEPEDDLEEEDDEELLDDEEEDEDDEAEEDDEDDEDEEQTVVVAPNGDHTFNPEDLEVDPGMTVEFVWENDGHNIVVAEQPEDADWEGVEELQDDGFTHDHTFEVEGQYEYHCDPHEDDGMEAVIHVSDTE